MSKVILTILTVIIEDSVKAKIQVWLKTCIISANVGGKNIFIKPSYLGCKKLSGPNFGNIYTHPLTPDIHHNHYTSSFTVTAWLLRRNYKEWQDEVFGVYR